MREVYAKEEEKTSRITPERVFVVVGNKAKTEPFNLNDLAGSAGRMDILCRCIAQTLFISHGVRKNSAVIIVLRGEPSPPKSVMVVGSEVKYMSPDERNIGGIIRKALSVKVGKEWVKSTPGVYVAKKDLKDVLEELKDYEKVYLKEGGEDIRKVKFGRKVAFFLGDHIGLSEEDEKLIMSLADRVVSVSPLSLQADQCIVIVHNELDRVLLEE